MALPAFQWDRTTQCCRAFTLALARLSCSLGRTVLPQYKTSQMPDRQTTDRQTTHCTIGSTDSTVGQKLFIFFTMMTSIDMQKSTLNSYIDKTHRVAIFMIVQLSCLTYFADFVILVNLDLMRPTKCVISCFAEGLSDTDIFTCLFLYSALAQKFTLGWTKASYAVNFGPLDLEKSWNFICLESGIPDCGYVPYSSCLGLGWVLREITFRLIQLLVLVSV